MPAGVRVASHVRYRLLALGAISILVLVMLAVPASSRAVQDPEAGSARSRVRIVHGIADAGPLDIYVDGSLALGSPLGLRNSA